jgi:hypothetical protein
MDAPDVKEDGDSPSGGVYELIILDGLTWLQINGSLGPLIRIFRRRWS